MSSMQTTTEYVSPADTAKLIRKALKAAFPGTKFRVRLSRGSATYVDWTDGPTRQQVQAVTGEFESETFDGMTDCRNYSGAVLYADADGSFVQRRYSSGLIIEHREWSDAVRDGLVAEFSRMREGSTGLPVSERVAMDFAWREFAATDYTSDCVAGKLRREGLDITCGCDKCERAA